jgi:hypothetical protein
MKQQRQQINCRKKCTADVYGTDGDTATKNNFSNALA